MLSVLFQVTGVELMLTNEILLLDTGGCGEPEAVAMHVPGWSNPTLREENGDYILGVGFGEESRAFTVCWAHVVPRHGERQLLLRLAGTEISESMLILAVNVLAVYCPLHPPPLYRVKKCLYCKLHST